MMTLSQMLGLPADWIVSTEPQGSSAWLDARRGCITGSMAKVAREKLKNGALSKPAITYARDTARARVGAGDGEEVFQNAAMRFGTEQEPFARRAYEVRTGYMVEAAGFVCTPDRKFGVSVDGLVYDEPEQRGGVEIKAIVSSNVLFETVVGGDISAYIDQCDMNIWAWSLDWLDLCLWAPDLPDESKRLTVIRILRDQDRIDALMLDLADFDKTVEAYAAELRAFMGTPSQAPAEEPQATPATTTPAQLAEAEF